MNEYHNIAEYYDLLMEAGYYNYPQVARSLFSVIKGRRKVLEIGIGTGLMAEELLKLCPECELTGLDFTPEMLEIARSRLGDKAKLVEGNVLDFDHSESFETIYSHAGSFLFSYENEKVELASFLVGFQDNVQALRNVSSNLEPGGLFALSIQKRGRDYKQDLGNGLVYSQKLINKTVQGSKYVYKDYFFKKDGNLVAHDHCIFHLFEKEEADEMMNQAGLRFHGFSPDNLFLVYKKV